MRDLLVAGVVALILAMIATPLLINWLRARGIGQQIREDGPQRHLTKAGTPTMGGLALIGAALSFSRERHDLQQDAQHADNSFRCIWDATLAWIQSKVIRFLWKMLPA